MGLTARLSVLLIAALLGTAGCGTSVAGRAVVGPDRCRAGEPANDRPVADAVPLLRLSSVSSWTPPWEYGASLSVYPDGTAARVAPAADGGSLRRAVPPALPVLRPLQAGWVDGCELPELVRQGRVLAGRDMGEVTGVMDASSAVVEIGADGDRPAARIGVYALNMGDEDSPDLSVEQRAARAALTAWMTEVRAAVRPTVSMSVDRLRLVQLGGGGRKADSDAVAWRGPTPQMQESGPDGDEWMHPCAVLSGDDARQAGLAMIAAHAGNDGSTRGAVRGEFILDGRTRTFAMVVIAPGEGCV